MPSLPPLESLRLFEAAARKLSFKAAAEELHITPAAVSQRIRQLETVLGVALFRRLPRQVVLTPEGLALAQDMRRALDLIETALSRLARQSDGSPVVISTTPTFAEQILLPVLGELQEAEPGRKVRVMVSDELIEPGTGGVDLAIRQGRGDYPGLVVTPLMACTYAPVGASGGANPCRVHIHVDWPARVNDPPSWQAWTAATGLSPPAARGELHVATEAMAIRAALAGQGLALAATAHVMRELASGALVLPFGSEATLPTAYGYFLAHAKGALAAPVRQVRDWLLARAAMPT
ncbi:MAG: LysR family transcriptional regulator [Gemmobacter sp.]|jgi:LysR family glycine cleavage system transcriptional activator|nr:LysR family transcriptional regulator [Gemmobacter sp.]